MTSKRMIERLSLYRRLLAGLMAEKAQNAFSHQLSKATDVTPAQVRRDMMGIGFSGNPSRGYDVHDLHDAITQVLDAPTVQEVALIGIGNLGRAILSYFTGRHARLAITAAFDTDPEKAGRVIHGCRCYQLDAMAAQIRERDIRVAILAVPADSAQSVTDILVGAGIHGILNFAPLRLRTPGSIFVEDMDLTTSLEKVAFFARRRTQP
ncbi:MAG: redox-sensing transcriptional repressor Rex [Kiritimatiellia bacterium]